MKNCTLSPNMYDIYIYIRLLSHVKISNKSESYKENLKYEGFLTHPLYVKGFVV